MHVTIGYHLLAIGKDISVELAEYSAVTRLCSCNVSAVLVLWISAFVHLALFFNH